MFASKNFFNQSNPEPFTLNDALSTFKVRLEDHVQGNITGKELVQMDIAYLRTSVITDSAIRCLNKDPNTKETYEKYIYWLSMYEPNVLLRGPPDGYIGDDELRVYTKALLQVFPELPL